MIKIERLEDTCDFEAEWQIQIKFSDADLILACAIQMATFLQCQYVVEFDDSSNNNNCMKIYVSDDCIQKILEVLFSCRFNEFMAAVSEIRIVSLTSNGIPRVNHLYNDLTGLHNKKVDKVQSFCEISGFPIIHEAGAMVWKRPES